MPTLARGACPVPPPARRAEAVAAAAPRPPSLAAPERMNQPARCRAAEPRLRRTLTPPTCPRAWLLHASSDSLPAQPPTCNTLGFRGRATGHRMGRCRRWRLPGSLCHPRPRVGLNRRSRHSTITSIILAKPLPGPATDQPLPTRPSERQTGPVLEGPALHGGPVLRCWTRAPAEKRLPWRVRGAWCPARRDPSALRGALRRLSRRGSHCGTQLRSAGAAPSAVAPLKLLLPPTGACKAERPHLAHHRCRHTPAASTGN